MATLKERIKEMEREEIVAALRECDWVMARAARRLGITERMIGYRIKKYGIRIKEVRWMEDSSKDDGTLTAEGLEVKGIKNNTGPGPEEKE